jgi:hypothetical protein
MTATKQRPSPAARRVGYLFAAAITAAMWWVINVWPGWEQLSFLTGQTRDVLWLVNVSLVASIGADLTYVVFDPPWFKALGDLVTTGISLVVTLRVWQVFPFDFSGYSFNWAALVRFILIVAVVGSIIGMTVQIVTLIRLAVTGGGPLQRSA